MLERARYVTTRPNADGSLRYYWQRRGQPLTRLPDDPIRRWEMQLAVNAKADRKEVLAVLEEDEDDQSLDLPGTIGWTVARYKSSPKYKDETAASTKKYYRRFLSQIRALGSAYTVQETRPDRD
jgi:hypothetical protein